MSRNPKSKAEGAAQGLAQAGFERHYRELRRFLLRRVPQAADAGDLVQEVFVRVLSIDRATLVSNPQAYLYGIAAHVAREFRVRSQRNPVSFDSQALETLAENPGELSPDEFMEGVSLERQVEHALAQLSPTHLKVLIADRRDGLSAEDIAARFGLSVHTVRKYLVQALTRIREGWYQGQDTQGNRS